MTASLAILFLVLSCGPGVVGPDRTTTRAAAAAHDDEEREWSRVLEIAGSRSAEARQQLEAIRAESKSERVRTLVTKILFLWNDETRTYEAAEPRPLDRECLPVATLKEILGDTGEMVRVVVEVTVSPTGDAESVRVLSGTPKDGRLRGAIERALMKARFVPRHVDGRYERGVARVECKAHVR